MLVELRNLDVSYNPEAKAQLLSLKESANRVLNLAMLIKEEKDQRVEYKEPTTFQEAWNHPDKFQQKKWREAIRKEFLDMIKQGVWRKTTRN